MSTIINVSNGSQLVVQESVSEVSDLVNEVARDSWVTVTRVDTGKEEAFQAGTVTAIRAE